jgi:hypothetical protein
MHNRIAQYWKNLDTLLESASAEAVAEPQRLAACPFNGERPMEVFLDRTYLRAVVATSVQSMKRHLRDLGTHTDATREHLSQEIERRQAFLRWLAADEHDQLYVMVYPTVRYPFVEDAHE